MLPPSYRGTEIDLSKLLLTADDFPLGWKANRTPEPEVSGDELDWGDENIVAAFQPTQFQGYANLHIYKFRNEAAAKYGLFWINHQGFFTPPPGDLPPGWSYRSSIADNWIFGCSADKACALLARYDEIIISFMTSMDPEYMTVDDLENLLKVIDKKINTYLGLNYTTYLYLMQRTGLLA